MKVLYDRFKKRHNIFDNIIILVLFKIVYNYDYEDSYYYTLILTLFMF